MTIKTDGRESGGGRGVADDGVRRMAERKNQR